MSVSRVVKIAARSQIGNMLTEVRLDPAGTVVATGTPERIVRLWDPRVGDKSIGKLIGHSDCVRSVIVSEDGRYVSC